MENNTMTTLTIKYGVSRGQDTYGYGLVTLYANGQKVARCSGGGYDMTGTVIGQWLEKTYMDRLEAIRDQAYNGETGLYGFFERNGRLMLDGACGKSAMERVAEAIGISIKWMETPLKDASIYLVTDNQEAM